MQLTVRLSQRLIVAALAIFLVGPPMALAQKPAPAKSPGNYKRIHQKALSQITGGNAAKAVAALQAVIRKHPDDAESYFMLTVALAQVGEVDEAVAAMQQAIKLGLPPGRFIAGPRDLLAPIHDSAAFKALAERYRSRPIHGPLVGSVTDSAATVWLRTAKEARVLLVAKGAGKSHYAEARSTAASDFTALAKITGLRPDTQYTYGLAISPGKNVLRNATWRFRTSPKPGAKTKFTLAFGGGAGYVPANERMWTTIGKLNPRLMLLLGDNTYSDAPKSPQMQKYCY